MMLRGGIAARNPAGCKLRQAAGFPEHGFGQGKTQKQTHEAALLSVEGRRKQNETQNEETKGQKEGRECDHCTCFWPVEQVWYNEDIQKTALPGKRE